MAVIGVKSRILVQVNNKDQLQHSLTIQEINLLNKSNTPLVTPKEFKTTTRQKEKKEKPYLTAIHHVGRSGTLVESMTLNRRVVGLNPALAATYGPRASP